MCASVCVDVPAPCPLQMLRCNTVYANMQAHEQDLMLTTTIRESRLGWRALIAKQVGVVVMNLHAVSVILC